MDAPFLDDMADSGTAAEILRKKFPGLIPSAPPPDAPPSGISVFDSGKAIPNSAPSTPNPEAPDVGQPTFENRFNLPWLPGYKPAQAPQPQAPGPTKAQKLGVILKGGLMGAIAGRAASEQAVIQSGGRRSGGFGTGAMAAIEQPLQMAAQQQALQRGGLENQLLSNTVQVAPQMNLIKLLQGSSEIQKNLGEADKNTAEAGAIPTKTKLEQAQTEAAYYKDDPNLGLIDIRTKQPVDPNGLAPLSAEEAGILGKQEGERVPLKLKNTANEMVNRGIRSVSAGGRQLLVDNKGDTIKDLGQATPLTVVNATMGAFGNPASPEVQAIVDQVGQGKMDLPTALSTMRRNPAAAASFMGALLQKYPDYNQANFGVSKKTMEFFTTGKGSEELNAFRTAIAHADLLDQAATALENHDTKALNTIKNALKTQFGDPEPTNFNVIANAYTREVTKALSAGHIDDSEIKTQGATMPQNAGPKQIHGAVEAYKNLMASKAQQRMIQYEQGLQAKPAFPDSVTAPNNAPKAPTFADWKANQKK